MPLLSAVNITGKDGDAIMKCYGLHYVPVNTSKFDTIEINIKDDTGQNVSFKTGKVICKLILDKSTKKAYSQDPLIYPNHFGHQVGGDLPGFKGICMQYGNGIGLFLRTLARKAITLIKAGVKILHRMLRGLQRMLLEN